jgi:hypothetical protein
MWTVTLVIFGLIVVMLVLVAILRATMREEPTGCIIVFGGLFFLIAALVMIVPWLAQFG